MKKKTALHRPAALVAVVCLLLVVLLDHFAEQKAESMYSQAVQAYIGQSYEEASTILYELEGTAPQYVPLYTLRAQIYQQTGASRQVSNVLQRGIARTGSSALIAQLTRWQDGLPLTETSFSADAHEQISITLPSVKPETGFVSAGQGSEAGRTEGRLNYDFIVRYPETESVRTIQLEAPSSGPAAWSSTDPTVATVDENGLVTCGRQTGEAEIQAVSSDGVVSRCWVYVIEPNIYASDNGVFVCFPEADISVQGTIAEIQNDIAQAGNVFSASFIPSAIIYDPEFLLDNAPTIFGTTDHVSGGVELTGKVDTDGNPILDPDQEAPRENQEDAHPIQINLGRQAIYFSGIYRIPSHLRCNGQEYAPEKVYFGYGGFLTGIVVPATVGSLGTEYRNPFATYLQLERFTVEEGNKTYSDLDGVLLNADGTKLLAYPCAASRTSYTIPDTVHSIGSQAFQNNQGLQTVTIPAGVTEIDTAAFAGMKSMKDFIVDEENPAFKTENGFLLSVDGTRLLACDSDNIGDTYTLDLGVSRIDQGIFSGCTKLRSLTIDDPLDHLMLDGLPKLEEVVCNGDIPSINIMDCPEFASVTINGQTQTLNIRSDKIVDLSGLRSAPNLQRLFLQGSEFSGHSALQDINSLTDLSISGLNVESVPDEIWGCSQLKSLQISCNYTEKGISLEGIQGMTLLESLQISGVQVSDLAPLMDCPQLREVTLSCSSSVTDCAELLDHPSLEKLIIYGAQLPEEQLEALREAGIAVMQ